MKRTKLFIPLFASLSIAPAVVSVGNCSCNNNSEAEEIANAIFDPTSAAEKTTNDFYDTLKKYSDADKKKEIIYDLFGIFNTNGFRGIDSSKSFKDLYKSNIVSIKTNITSCEFTSFDGSNKATVKFLGYVSFVFTKDYKVGETIVFKANDYVMVTYDLSGQPVEIANDKCSLKYTVSGEKACVGMIKEMKEGKSALYYIDEVNTSSLNPTNSQNYTKI